MRIFAKTDAGMHEIETRQLPLSFVERTTLLMIDGKRSDEEICKRLQKFGDIAEAIAVLHEIHLVRLIMGTTPMISGQNKIESATGTITQTQSGQQKRIAA